MNLTVVNFKIRTHRDLFVPWEELKSEPAPYPDHGNNWEVHDPEYVAMELLESVPDGRQVMWRELGSSEKHIIDMDNEKFQKFLTGDRQ